MNSFDYKTPLGSAFNDVKLEHEYLDSFIGILMEKVVMDERHLNDLKSLERTWNPNWTTSGIWPLISPLLNYFRDEISRVERSIAEIMPRIAKLKDAPSPDESHPGNLLDDLGVTSQKEQEALKVARQIDPSVVKASRFGSKENLLLDEDRKYRKAVWVQNNAVDRATSWYTKNIPKCINNALKISNHVFKTC